MRRSLAFLIVLGLLVASATAVAAQGRGRGGGSGGERGPPAEIGAFVSDSSTVTGEHVSFSYSDAGITDFTAANVTLFDLAVAGDEGDDEADDKDKDDDEDDNGSRARSPRVVSEGAFFRVRAANFTFSAHDNPSAVAKLQADGTFAFTFASGVVLTPGDEDTYRFSAGGLNGTIRGDDLDASGRRVSGTDGALVFLHVPRGEFDVHREDIGQAIAKGHVGAEASFNAAGDDEDEVEHDVVSYGNVTMTTVKAERGNLTVMVEGHGLEGRVLVLNVDGRMLGADRADKLNITLDNETIDPASSLEDVLDPDDDGFSPEYYVVYDPGVQAFQVIVTVPHYSVHTLTVATLVDIIPPSVTVGILVGVLVVVPMALVLFRRK